MRADYNPYVKNKGTEETEHGLINYTHDMGTVYVTHRRPEHFFKKFRGFGISKSELEVCFDKNVFWVMVMYHRKDGTTIPYRVKLSNLRYMDEYDHEGDEQVIVPVKEMEQRIEEGWKKDETSMQELSSEIKE